MLDWHSNVALCVSLRGQSAGRHFNPSLAFFLSVHEISLWVVLVDFGMFWQLWGLDF